MQELKQSDPRAGYRRVYFDAVDATDPRTSISAADMAGGTWSARLTKNGTSPLWTSSIAAPAAALTPVEYDAVNAKGLFYLELLAADIDTPGWSILHIANTGGTKSMLARNVQLRIHRATWVTAVAGTLSSTQFTSDFTGALDTLRKDAWLLGTVGSNIDEIKKLGSYTAATKLFGLAAGYSFPFAVSVGDVFELINR